ncbi:hypothetical protein ABTX84_08845 [Streptomyces sp. NPDC095614]|uniref:hypothetical protein n=1 Tax=Streptomyces sp. NPDC095614 TaxID=3156692 RepID=UPI00332DC7EE
MSQQDATAQLLMKLHEQARISIDRTTGSNSAVLGQLLRLDLDIKSFERRISGRPEVTQLRSARKELGYAVYAAAAGQYRMAYGSVRLFLELGFAAVYFSANELKRRKWLSDRGDFSWSKALDEDEGVLSKSFVMEFNEEAVGHAAGYSKSAALCYRHCSQFIHGKASVTDHLPDGFEYSPDILVDWLETSKKAAESVLYLLYCRYADELLASDDGHELRAAIEHSFGHIPEVRNTLGLA